MSISWMKARCNKSVTLQIYIFNKIYQSPLLSKAIHSIHTKPITYKHSKQKKATAATF